MSAPGDLSICSREPIHIPGAIQPHGALLVLREPDLEICQASSNAARFCGVAEGTLTIGSRLGDLEPFAKAAAALVCAPEPLPRPMVLEINGRTFDGLPHRSGGVLILELEANGGGFDFPGFYAALQRGITAVQGTSRPDALYQEAARAIAGFTGYERVMVYQFDPEWNGRVVGEVLAPGSDSYLGLHFPASDIPAQARELYRRNRLRIIPDATYEPVPVLPTVDPETGQPLDLSGSLLRSVSPVHLEYLRNMGVVASMSISLLHQGELWGLISCHHSSARPLPYTIRAACELFGQIVSAQIGHLQEQVRQAAMLEARRVQAAFFEHFAREDQFREALQTYTPTFLEMVEARGAALCFDREIVLQGQAPNQAQVGELLEWLKSRPRESDVVAIDALSAAYPPAAAFQAVASGLLAVSTSRARTNFVLWFRPEVISTVTWAGNPQKSVHVEGNRIDPRKSFAAWREQVTGRSLPWRESDRQAALELRAAINALILRRTDSLLRLNAELERKNSDLHSFAYIASHDLQEPLRGLRNVSDFLIEDHGAELSPAIRAQLQEVRALSVQMEQLILALAHFTRVGRMELTLAEVDLNTLVDEVRRSRASALSGVDFRISRPLPTVVCDPVLVREVFANLFTNAAKFRNKSEPWIEVGVEEDSQGGPPTFYVRDNGIGIREKHFDHIFEIFRRLHPRDRFGGGTGIGLSIVKAIVMRHGGRIWCESVFGTGSTFFLTLAPASQT